MIKKTIETERLILRGFTEADLEDFYAYAKSPNVGPNAGWAAHKSIEESKEILHKVFLDGDNEEAAVVDKESGKVIGSIGLVAKKDRDIPNSWGLGYVLSEDFWGMGLMTEAAKAMIKYAFEELNAEILTILHYSFNDRSKRVIEKCGFKYEGTLRMARQLFDGRIVDDVMYSMLKNEYEAQK